MLLVVDVTSVVLVDISDTVVEVGVRSVRCVCKLVEWLSKVLAVVGLSGVDVEFEDVYVVVSVVNTVTFTEAATSVFVVLLVELTTVEELSLEAVVVVCSLCSSRSVVVSTLECVVLFSCAIRIFSSPSGHCGQHWPCTFTGSLQVAGKQKLLTHSRSPCSQ